MTIHIITDGSADLPKALRQEWGIKQIPLSVQFSSKSFDSDMESTEFYKSMKSDKQLPKTSSPSPNAFMDHIRSLDGNHFLIMTMSSQISSTYQHAMMAKAMLEEEDESRSIEVIDSKTASLGLGLLVYQAARLAADGVSFPKLVSTMKEKVKRTKTMFVLDTLENVIKGGRLDRAKGAVASLLNIKLLMHASSEGVIEVVEKVRGSKQAIRSLIDKIGEFPSDVKDRLLGIAHSNCEAKARSILAQIRERYSFGDAVISDMGPVIGTYAGEGGILITF